MTKSDSSIEIRDLYKIFGSHPQKYVEAVKGGMSKAELAKAHGHILGLNNINISMPAGRIQVVMGLSGSGKSTLIRHVNRLIEPTSGSILIDGKDVLAMSELDLREFRRNNTAMVFQRFGLLPHRTVIDNVTFGLEVRGVDKGKARDTGMRWIERVGLHGFETRYPDELSGGMQQRVGIARALTCDPAMLLMDEPMAALDALTRETIQELLLRVWQHTSKMFFFITHSVEEALFLGSRLIVMSPRPGRITHSYDLDFNRRFLESGNARAIKSSPDFIEMRETILGIIYGDERASGNPELAHA